MTIYNTMTLAIAAKRVGGQCINLVGQVCQFYRSNPKVAQQKLEVIKECIPGFIAKLQEKEQDYERRRDQKQATEASLERQINSKEAEKKTMQNRINDIEERRKIHEMLIDEKKEELESAKTRKKQAEQHHKQVTNTVTAGTVGAVALGLIAPPTLIMTLPIVAVGTGLRVVTSKTIEDHQKSIDNIQLKITNDEQQLKSYNTIIGILSDDIVNLQSQLQCLYSDREQLRNVIVFMQRAVCYFGEMQVAVEAGKQRTNLLHRILKAMNTKQEYKIKSKGIITVANSFAEAWRSIEDGLISGSEAGFLNIEFDNSFDPHDAIEMQQVRAQPSFVIFITVVIVFLAFCFFLLWG